MQYGYFDDERREYVITGTAYSGPMGKLFGIAKIRGSNFQICRRIQLCKIRS